MGSASAGEWVAAVLNPDCHKADDEGEDACDDCRNVSEKGCSPSTDVLTSYC